MQSEIRRWLDTLPLNDPLERQQAGLLQIMLLIILGGCAVGLLISFSNASTSAPLSIALISYAILIVCTLSALFLLRRGRFNPAVGLAVSGIILAVGLALIASGLPGSAGIFMAFTVPVTMAGLLLDRKGLLVASGAVIGVVLLVALLQSLVPGAVGFIPSRNSNATSLIPIFILIVAVLSLFLDRFGMSLRDALTATQARENELEQLRASLEATVAERTTSLQQALQEGEQREARLALALEELRASQQAVRELSAPVIPVLPGVLIAPLIGALDGARAADLTDNVLAMVQREHAHHVIFDITGVPLVDTHVAQVLLQTTTAVRLLGAQALLVGIRPEVAQTMVALNLNMGELRSYSVLREAIGALLATRSEQSKSAATQVA
ncbi:MAG TPA: STAS domain-containing protein [Roseiflexaceae bacterium]|nr:STAS domain-containing protein [Roseiflexaceae bacterium]